MKPQANAVPQADEPALITPADELRAAADRLAPPSETPPTLTGEYPDLDACYAHILRTTAETCDAVTRHGVEPDQSAQWLAPALAAARAINGDVAVINASEIELDGGDVMLQEMSVGDPIEIDRQTGPLRPGCWVITAFEAQDRSRARVRRLSREEIEAARRGEAFGQTYA